MTIARRRPATMTAIAPSPGADARAPVLLPGRPSRPPLLLGGAPTAGVVKPAGTFRRCVFRRIDRIAPPPRRSAAAAYEVMCLYGDGDAAVPLGDIEAARPVCEACTASGIFRPDEA